MASSPAWLRDGRGATRGHDDAVATVSAWGRDGVPHAILITGPGSVGKATLARDLAAALLCTGDPGGPVPCGRCTACVRVVSGNHPDLHVLRPTGPGGQVRIGGRDAPEPGVRDLVSDLALSAAEGGRRMAIVESAHRMNEDAQNALLRTLEEPPPGVVIALCADDEDRLLPTIRSRCVRVRLGPVSSRAIEDLLGEAGLADPAAAARLARLAEGRPGVALALARRPDAVRAREELLRRLLDLAGEGPAARLAAAPSLLAAARETAAPASGADGADDPGGPAGARAAGRGAGGTGRSRKARARDAEDAAHPDAPSTTDGRDPSSVDPDADASVDGEEPAGRKRRPPAAERREAARGLIDAWRVIARDLAVAAVGGRRELRDAALLEETREVAGRLPAGAAVAFLARLEETERLVESNVSPELAIDTLLLAWPRASDGPKGAATGTRAALAAADGRRSDEAEGLRPDGGGVS